MTHRTTATLLATALLALLGLLTGAATRAAERPNVLFICGDDHAAYVYGAYGNTRVRTPNLDRLAASGIRFDRAYCNAPVCTASRAAFITGRYPRSVGVSTLPTPLPADATTLADALSAAGYETCSIGKTHFNSNLKHGYDVLIDAPDFRRDLKARGTTPLPEGEEVLAPWKPFKTPAREWLNSQVLPEGAVDADMEGTFYAHSAAEFLTAERERPFFLMVSLKEPHSPFRFPVEFRGRHHPAEFDVPPVTGEDAPQVPAIFRELSPEEKQGIAAAYYTSVEFLDENVGRVLAALEASGQADNTLVVYIGDHGYMLGQHGRFEKHCSFEPAVRAPLVISLPGRISAGRATSALVEFIDILPTVLELCQVDLPAEVQGRTLVPIVDGKTDRHRDHVFVEYAANAEALVRTERWKLVYLAGNRERDDGYTTGQPLPGRQIRLFDLESDPDELHNLADDPAHAEVREELLDQLANHLVHTAREPDKLPPDADRYTLLDACVQPNDLPREPKPSRSETRPTFKPASREQRDPGQ